MISLTGEKFVSRQFLDPCCRLSTRVTHALVSSFFLLLASRVWRICKDHLYPFWNEWALNIVGCRPQSRFKWWSSTTRFKKPRHISVLQLRNQSCNRFSLKKKLEQVSSCRKQKLQGRHALDELFLLLVGLSKGTFRCQNSIQQQLQTESDQTDTGAMNKEQAVPDHWIAAQAKRWTPA